MGYSLHILPLLGGQISSLLKSHGDPGCEGIANKLKISEICGGKKWKKKMELQTDAIKKTPGTNTNTQTNVVLALFESLELDNKR